MPSFPKPATKIEDPYAVTVDQLITAYRGSIDLLRKELNKELEAHKAIEKTIGDDNFGDDIYLLRWVLMNYEKGFDKAKKYLKMTMEWRAKNAKVLESYRKGATPANDENFRRFMHGTPHYRTVDGHYVFLSRSGLGNAEALLEKVTPAEVTTYMTQSKESFFALCDAETRLKNKLISVVTILDFAHASSNSSKFRSATDDHQKEMERMYPMLMGKTMLFNVPTFLRAIMKVALVMMSKQSADKILVCSGETPAENLEFAKTHLKLEKSDMPTFLGGSCDCQNGCCLGVPNDRTKLYAGEEAAGRKVPTWEECCARAADRPAL